MIEVLREDLQLSYPIDANDHLEIVINDKKYKFTPKDDSPYDVSTMVWKVKGIMKHSHGRALQFLKKNMIGSRVVTNESFEHNGMTIVDDNGTWSVHDSETDEVLASGFSTDTDAMEWADTRDVLRKLSVDSPEVSPTMVEPKVVLPKSTTRKMIAGKYNTITANAWVLHNPYGYKGSNGVVKFDDGSLQVYFDKDAAEKACQYTTLSYSLIPIKVNSGNIKF